MSTQNIGILISLMFFSSLANAGNNWYANTYDNNFIVKLLNGSKSEDKSNIKKQLDAFIDYDIKDNNFPYTKEVIYGHFNQLVSNGIRADLKNNEEHEYQWYVLMALLSPGIVSEIHYAPANQKWIADDPVGPRSIHFILSKNNIVNSRLEILSYGNYYSDSGFSSNFSPRNKGASCSKREKFGLCIYDFIVLTANEVKVIRDEILELRKSKLSGKEYDEFYQFIFVDIFDKACKEKKALVFYAYD